MAKLKFVFSKYHANRSGDSIFYRGGKSETKKRLEWELEMLTQRSQFASFGVLHVNRCAFQHVNSGKWYLSDQCDDEALIINDQNVGTVPSQSHQESSNHQCYASNLIFSLSGWISNFALWKPLSLQELRVSDLGCWNFSRKQVFFGLAPDFFPWLNRSIQMRSIRLFQLFG